MSEGPSPHKQDDSDSRDRGADLQRRLWRRLLWKAPLILLLVSFAVWWEWRKETTTNPAGEPRLATKAQAVTGTWSAQVNYPWGGKFSEEFFFQPEGGKLFGTASFLGSKRGIEEGRIEGDNFSFFIRFQQTSEGVTTDHKNYYWGKLAGDEVQMRLQDDRGNPPLDFVLSKTAKKSRLIG